MFKNIVMIFTIGFEVNGKTEQHKVKIERHESGASRYGDHSAHSVKLDNAELISYDTRYEGITTEKSEWIAYWIEWIISTWSHNKDFNLSFSLKDYKESEE